ncbi:MAG TPA: sigma-70 family RNA polymerase sigma factor [Patescibacteria group bacterium]|nr:sigma-70 family RNA polymerase sigma factor [Patescibacteria group bacterium]
MQSPERLFANNYLQYIDEIYKYIFFAVRQHVETAEDLTSTVFLKAWRSMERFDAKKASFRVYLYTIARNTVIDHYRSFKIIEELDSNTPVKKQEDDYDIDIQLFWQHASTVLHSEVYHCLILKYRNDLSVNDMSIIMGKTPDSIKSLLKRARQQLQQNYSQKIL